MNRKSGEPSCIIRARFLANGFVGSRGRIGISRAFPQDLMCQPLVLSTARSDIKLTSSRNCVEVNEKISCNVNVIKIFNLQAGVYIKQAANFKIPLALSNAEILIVWNQSQYIGNKLVSNHCLNFSVFELTITNAAVLIFCK